jgi:hypothetical protein
MNVLLLGLAAAAGFAAPPQCVVQPSTTVAHTDHSRVVYVRKNEERTGLQRIYYGCYGRHRRRLGVRGCFPDFCDLEQFRLAGPMVAFAEVYAGRGDPAFDIHVRNLRTGRVVRDVPARGGGVDHRQSVRATDPARGLRRRCRAPSPRRRRAGDRPAVAADRGRGCEVAPRRRAAVGQAALLRPGISTSN